MTITKLRGAEYLLRSVADGVEDYFMGVGEAPGVWHGRWAEELGLVGVVDADHLRALVEGRHPTTGVDLVAGHRERTVKAIDLTLSAPKSVSLLWAFGGDEAASEVSIALVEAATSALDFMERHAAVTRRQRDGVRRRVGTRGFSVAMFTHRTSRDGDPQLHVHSLLPNLVERDDGVYVAIDANPMHEWLKASGTIFQSELQRRLTARLGVTWGPERNGCRELVGFTPEQRRAFSKRTAAIEAVLEAGDEAVTSKERMRADDRASLVTRRRKDLTLTPERLRSRWGDEATRADIGAPDRVRRTVCHQAAPAGPIRPADLFAALVDPTTGLCATEARFGHAHVVERVAALSGGGLTVAEIEQAAEDFLRSDLVVRLATRPMTGRRKPAQWSTVEHRRIEDELLARLARLRDEHREGVDPRTVADAIGTAALDLGADQRAAMETLCAPGASLRVVLAPAGHGKTAMTAAAAAAAAADGHHVVVLATTNKAVAELRAAGLDASTIARFRLHGEPLAPGSIVVIDEVSQVSTRDAHYVTAAVAGTPGAALWCLGDDDQGRPVQPGGLATELRRLADGHTVPAATLSANRRQADPAERQALESYRAGDITRSQEMRREHGWEHAHETPAATRDELARAAVTDADALGADKVAVLAVSHADCEDLADRIRAIRQDRGELAGPSIEGPAWSASPRRYAAGDRILCHAPLRLDGHRLTNGATGTITAIAPAGAVARIDDGPIVLLATHYVTGCRPDGTPNLSHAWARTIDGAQGGTWEQVHLLATPNLDRLTTYVGQSRGRRPTHTWNTAREPSGEEHGNVVIDPRSPDEQVLAAAARVPDRTFAALDDPFVLDRRLQAERAEHQAALAAGPPDVSLTAARHAASLERREQEARAVWDELRGIDRRLARTGGLRQLRPETRRTHAALLAARDAASDRLESFQEQLRTDRALAARLDAAADEHRRWAAANQWRHDEIGRIDRQLADHWTDTVLAAVREDDPLAYGLDRLRQARAVLSARQGDDAERDLAAVTEALGSERVSRLHAIADGAPAPDHLTSRLGPLPAIAAARDTWLGLAIHVERRLDAGLPIERTGGFSIAERLDRLGKTDPLDNPRAILAASPYALAQTDPELPSGPERWLDAVDRSTAAHQAIERQQARELDRGLGISL